MLEGNKCGRIGTIRSGQPDSSFVEKIHLTACQSAQEHNTNLSVKWGY